MAPQRQRILIIAHDSSWRAFINRALQRAGFRTLALADADDRERLEDELFDLIVLDPGLPGRDGIAVYRRLREWSAAPIIVFSSAAAPADPQALLACDADDVLATPFSAEALLTRVQVVLRRAQNRLHAPTPPVLKSGALQINFQTGRVVRHGQDVPLSRTDWAVLELLARHAGQVLPARTLLHHVWGDAYQDERGYLRTYIGRLRNKLEDDPRRPRYIVTEPRLGYRFMAPEQAVEQQTRTEPPQAAASSLPLPPTSFVGRDQELAAVIGLLHQPTIRLLTLTGPGGTGKTRLALRVAAQLQPEFADGVLFVPLATIRDPDVVPVALAQALGIARAHDRPLIEQLTDALRDQHLLLVMDNFEQVLPAATIISDLLPAAPRLKVLATSRAVLHIYGEHEFNVPPLALPDPADLGSLDLLLRAPAIALFAERAQAVRPDFALTAANAAHVAELCARLDGLPLAIELAAARIKALSPQAMAPRLDQRLALLTGGPRDLPPRQQTLRATLDWSYELLAPAQQTLFARLAVFVDGCTLPAAEVVCGPDRAGQEAVLDGLIALIDSSMILQRETGGEPRFGMLETIREYACDRLVAGGEGDRLQQRHAAYFATWAEAAARGLADADQHAWLARLDREYSNLRAAITWAIDHDRPLALRFVSALWQFWHIHGHQREASRWIEAVLSQTATERSATRANVLYGAGWLAYDLRDLPRAKAYYTASLELFRALDDRRGIAEALHGLGEIALSQGAYAHATATFEESLALTRSLNDTAGIAWSLNHLGRVALEQGDYDRATQFFEACMATFDDLGERTGSAWSLHNLGRIALEQGRYDQAERTLSVSLDLFHDLGDRSGEAWTRHALARTALEQARYDQAVALFDACLPLFRALGDKRGTAWTRYSLGRIAAERHERERAVALFADSLRLFRELDDRRGSAWSLYQLGRAAAAQGADKRAIPLLEESLAQATGDTACRELASTLLAAISGQQADPELASGGYDSAPQQP